MVCHDLPPPLIWNLFFLFLFILLTISTVLPAPVENHPTSIVFTHMYISRTYLTMLTYMLPSEKATTPILPLNFPLLMNQYCLYLSELIQYFLS